MFFFSQFLPVFLFFHYHWNRHDATFLQEAVRRKHAADREQNPFNQVTLYLEAVVYFLLSGASMEENSRSEEAAWTMYRDTLSLIK